MLGNNSSIKTSKAWLKFTKFCAFFDEYVNDYLEGNKYKYLSESKQQNQKQK